jgi:hypothetical protein
MNKISALEGFKATVILEEMVQRLSFLDQLKSSMGEEMTEMMSEEITRVMNEQSTLERKYAELVK